MWISADEKGRLLCVDTPSVPCAPLQCRCEAGFQLKRDGKTCVDVDECTTSYPCTQRCINTHGSFHCLCVDGFELSPIDPTICKSTSGTPRPQTSSSKDPWMGLQLFSADRCSTECHQLKCLISFPPPYTEKEPYLIFANRYYLRKLNLDGSNYTLIKQVSVAVRR